MKMPLPSRHVEIEDWDFVLTYMYYFGVRIQKPTHLWGNLPTRHLLRRSQPRHIPVDLYEVRYKMVGNKRVRVTTGRRALQQTAEYTLAFGEALCEAWQRAYVVHA